MSKSKVKRQPISKALRFEVFKRDKFKCQYCGASAPQVLLQVDHINPVAKNGKNDILNLITACFECNNGKRDKLLSDDSIITKQKEQLEQLQERREQLEMMVEWHQGLKNLDEDSINKLKKYWESLAKGFIINNNGIGKIAKLLKKFDFDEILKAMDAAATQYLEWNGDVVTLESWELAFSKIGAIISIERLSKENPDLKDFYYIRGIIRNRLNYYNPQLTMDWLEAARSWGATIEELKKIACTTKNWTTFSDDIDEIIKTYKSRQQDYQKIHDINF
jgi:hypothetical protein